MRGRHTAVMAFAAAVALLTSGCLVVPKTVTTWKPLGTRSSRPRRAGPSAIWLRGLGDGGLLGPARSPTVHVTATEAWSCRRRVTRIFRSRSVKEAKVLDAGGAGGGYAAVILAPIAVASLVYTISVVSHSKPEERIVRDRLSVLAICARPAGGREVRLEGPGLPELVARTDDAGRAVIVLPAGAPRSGAASLSMAGAKPVAVRWREGKALSFASHPESANAPLEVTLSASSLDGQPAGPAITSALDAVAAQLQAGLNEPYLGEVDGNLVVELGVTNGEVDRVVPTTSNARLDQLARTILSRRRLPVEHGIVRATYTVFHVGQACRDPFPDAPNSGWCPHGLLCRNRMCVRPPARPAADAEHARPFLTPPAARREQRWDEEQPWPDPPAGAR